MRTDGAREIVLIGKPMCHLCDDARAIVAAVCAETGQRWSERSILDDAALYDEYWERIPVVLVDGRVHAVWRVDPEALRRELSENRT